MESYHYDMIISCSGPWDWMFIKFAKCIDICKQYIKPIVYSKHHNKKHRGSIIMQQSVTSGRFRDCVGISKHTCVYDYDDEEFYMFYIRTTELLLNLLFHMTSGS